MREDFPSNLPMARRECEVHTVCFSIYGTLGEPHLALSMSSLMYSHLSTAHRIPAGAHRHRAGAPASGSPGESVCISFWVLAKWEKYHFFWDEYHF